MNEQKVLALFRSGKQEVAFRKLYGIFPKFKGYVAGQGGQKEMAEDLFQDALVVVFKRLSDAGFEFSGSLETYLFNTAKYMWWKANGENKEIEQRVIELTAEGGNELEMALEQERKLSAVEQVITELGEKCKAILIAFYHQGLHMKEIAKKFGYNSEKTAKNQKYKCLERARKQVINR